MSAMPRATSCNSFASPDSSRTRALRTERCHSVATRCGRCRRFASPSRRNPPLPAGFRDGRYWARTSDPQLVEPGRPFAPVRSGALNPHGPARRGEGSSPGPLRRASLARRGADRAPRRAPRPRRPRRRSMRRGRRSVEHRRRWRRRAVGSPTRRAAACPGRR